MNRLLFEALSQTLFYSLLHGSFIFLVYKVSAFLLRNHTVWLYRMALFTLLLLFLDFTGNFYLRVSSATYSSVVESADIDWQKTFVETIQGWFMVHSQVLGYVYLIGFCLCSLWMLTGFAGLHFKKGKQHVQPSEEWLKRLQFFACKTGIRKPVQLFLSVKNTVPCTFGFFRPIIVMPMAMLAQLSYEQMETILLHELAHIRRNDYLVNLCQCLIENLLFFNPFAWLISTDIRIVRELSCDDFVINHGKDSVIYAEALAIIENHRFTTEQLALNANGPKTGSLFHRILRITNMKKTSLTPHLKLAVIIMMVMAIAALAFTPERTNLSEKKSGISRTDSSTSVETTKMLMQDTVKTAQKQRAKVNRNGKIPPPPPPVEPRKNTSSEPPAQKVEEIEIMPPVVKPDRDGKIPPPPPPVEPKKKRTFKNEVKPPKIIRKGKISKPTVLQLEITPSKSDSTKV